MKKRALLLGVLLVVLTLTASGCIGGLSGLIGGIIGDGGSASERAAVNAVIGAFVTAWDEGNAEGMASRLASTVTFHSELFEGSEATTSGDDLADTLLTPDSGMQIVEVDLVQGPSTTVQDSSATATGNMLAKYTWVMDPGSLLFRGRDPMIEVEDIYPVEFGLEKSGSDWAINYLKISVGTRLSAITESWETFAEGIVEEDVDQILSVCTEPFTWRVPSGSDVPDFSGVQSHDQWRDALDALFDDVDIYTFDLTEAVALILTSDEGWLFGQLNVDDDSDGGDDGDGDGDSGEPLLLTVEYDSDDQMWKLKEIDMTGGVVD